MGEEGASPRGRQVHSRARWRSQCSGAPQMGTKWLLQPSSYSTHRRCMQPASSSKLEKGGILRKIWRCSTAVRELRQVNHKNSWASPGFHPSRHPLLTPPLWAARGLLLSIFAGEETGPEGSILCPQSHSSELAKVGSKLRQDECRALASLSLSVLTYKRGRRI